MLAWVQPLIICISVQTVDLYPGEQLKVFAIGLQNQSNEIVYVYLPHWCKKTHWCKFMYVVVRVIPT